MELEKFNSAVRLRHEIDRVQSKMSQIQKMKRRDKDEEFNECRVLAYDALNLFKKELERKFEQLYINKLI